MPAPRSYPLVISLAKAIRMTGCYVDAPPVSFVWHFVRYTRSQDGSCYIKEIVTPAEIVSRRVAARGEKIFNRGR